ncbi:hypothetical protein JXQ31_05150 [candidate division KSB1 bacterium]|nr:hypothetical protein [candidate division KSB1 bacterium]
MKLNLKKKIFNISYWSILLLFLLIVFEFTFDIFEIALGRFLLLTNPVRPKTGRLWIEEKKDVDAGKIIDSLTVSIKQDSVITPRIYSIEDLHAALSLNSNFQLNKNAFKEFYKQLSVRQAQKIIDPLNFLEIDRNRDWQFVNFVLDENMLYVYFIDGFGKLLYEKNLNFDSFYENSQTTAGSDLDQIPQYKNRIFSADIFYQAFEKLSKQYKLQIVNDPYRLVQWGENLQRVGISSVVEDGTVKVAFEVRVGSRNQLYILNSSEIAAGYLIDKINGLKRGISLKFPVQQEKIDE